MDEPVRGVRHSVVSAKQTNTWKNKRRRKKNKDRQIEVKQTQTIKERKRKQRAQKSLRVSRR
jgi:hypothetical protein